MPPQKPKPKYFIANPNNPVPNQESQGKGEGGAGCVEKK